MNYQELFNPYTKAIDDYLAAFFAAKTTKAAKTTEVGAGLWRHLQGLMTGGKRIRGNLVRLGYLCFQADDQIKLLPASAAVEVTQGAILIHDDIIDQSYFRHNQPTVHKLYEEFHHRHYQKGEAAHYGESMAIVVGILGYYVAFDLLAGLDFDESKKNLVMKEYCRFMTETAYGEALDVDLADRSEVEEDNVYTIHALKTAQYTFVGPLTVGGLLAGATQKQLRQFREFGLPVGVAYQLQDDILGVFGDPAKTGKPADDDVKEGKNTLLYTRALKEGNRRQQTCLAALWGKKDLTEAEFAEVKKIIVETGALAYSEEKMKQLAAEGKRVIPALTTKPEYQAVFTSLTDYLLKREK